MGMRRYGVLILAHPMSQCCGESLVHQNSNVVVVPLHRGSVQLDQTRNMHTL